MRVSRVRVSTLVRRLTERDAALLCQLAVCRYLRTEQVRALYFPNATLDRASQRLRELAARRLVGAFDTRTTASGASLTGT